MTPCRGPATGGGGGRARVPGALFAPADILPCLLLALVGCGQQPDGTASSAAVVGPFHLADSLRAEGRHGEALVEYRRLRDSLRAAAGDRELTAADSVRLWHAEVWSAYGFVHAGDPEGARLALEAAADLTGDDLRRRARTRWVRSLWHDRRGRLDSALVEARRVRVLAEEAGDPGLASAALNALGRIHSLAGRYRRALEVHESYLRLQRRRGDPRGVALALNEVGIDYRHFGRFDDALEAYREALDVYREENNPEGMAMVLYNVANVQLDMGRREEALATLSRSLEHTEAIDHTYGQGLLHNNLGRLHLEVGHRQDARRHLERALAIHGDAGLAYGSTVGLNLLGRLELEEGRPGVAREALLEAVARADSSGLGRQRTSALALLSRADVALGRPDRAVARSLEAVTASEALEDPEARYEALVALGGAREAASDPRAALDAYRRAMGLLESWRGRLALGDLRLGVAAPRLEAHEGAVRLLVEAGRPGEAFRVAEAARGRLLLELMADRRPELSPTSRVDSLRSALRDGYRRLRAAGADERPGIEADLSRAAEALETVERTRRGAGREASVARPRPVDAEAVREEVLGPDQGLLAYFWGDRKVYGWWLDRARLVVRDLGSADSLAATVDFLRNALQDPAGEVDWRPAARRLARELVAPLRPGDGDLLIVPDGPLAALPFEVLPDPESGKSLGLIRRVSYAPSASVLTALTRHPEDPEPDRGTLVVAVRDPPEPTALPSLPHVREEARRVAALFDGAETLLGRSATRERWRAMEPGRYRHLHFATHALADARWPGRARLLMADGPLDIPAIRGLELRADLVTLSACETGLGRRVPGEGVLGLTHAFLSAGARGVLVTLWRVRDRSAARFMDAFYGRLRQGRPPAEALRLARRSFLEAGGRDAHPARWAPYVLVGPGRR